MARKGRKPSLTKLQDRKDALAAQIKDLKREERREQAALEKRRFEVMGRALAKAVAADDDLADRLRPVLEAHVTKASERELLGLPKQANEPPPAEATRELSTGSTNP